MAVALLAAGRAGATSSAKCTAFAVLKPGNEVMPPSNSNTSGAALVHINGDRVSFAVAFTNPDRERFFAGHIHRGVAGENGPVVVTLFMGSSTSRLFTQFDSVMDADAPAICDNLSGYYVNYHSDEFPAGVLRGQLVRLF